MKLLNSVLAGSATLALTLALSTGAQAQAPAATSPKPAATVAKGPVSNPAVPAVAQPKKAAPKPLALSAQPARAKVAVPKSAAKKPDKPAAKIAGQTESPDQAPVSEPVGARRDPFVSLVNDRKEGGGPTLPPGKAGLVVATVRVDGTVKSGAELIAVVSNPERHVYFIRPGDQLYDGTVEKIDLDGVTFHENSKDAFGKPVVREVTKRIYASVGEQQ